MPRRVNMDELGCLIEMAKLVARRYREVTGKPLGIVGEVGEYEAARLLGLHLAEARQPGYDATDDGEKRIQIKTRCVLPDSKPGQRMGRIQLEKDWDTVLLVLLDENLEPLEIHEAGRPEITGALEAPGSKARNERGALGVSKFKSIGMQVWKKKE